MKPNPERPRLPPQLRRDMFLDIAGNLALGFGIWGWLGAREGHAGLLHTPALFIALTAAGILNFVHLPARLRRLRAWRDRQPPH